MTLTIAPSDAACQAIVDRVNAGTSYALDLTAHYSRTEIDRLEEIDRLRVDVVSMTESQPNDTLDGSDNSVQQVQIVVRKKLFDKANEIPAMMLLTRQIFLQVDNFTSSDRTVGVWETDLDEQERPDKSLLNEASLFVAAINLRVEVAR